MFIGWIIAEKEQGPALERFGVKLGPYNDEDHSFEDCEVSQEAFKRLEPFWGLFYWILRPKEAL